MCGGGCAARTISPACPVPAPRAAAVSGVVGEGAWTECSCGWLWVYVCDHFLLFLCRGSFLFFEVRFWLHRPARMFVSRWYALFLCVCVCVCVLCVVCACVWVCVCVCVCIQKGLCRSEIIALTRAPRGTGVGSVCAPRTVNASECIKQPLAVRGTNDLWVCVLWRQRYIRESERPNGGRGDGMHH